MTERTTRLSTVAVGAFAAALSLANIVLLVLGSQELNNDEGRPLHRRDLDGRASMLYVADRDC